VSDEDMRPGRIHMAINAERWRQHAKWGVQNHPDGTGDLHRCEAEVLREDCQVAFERGYVTWRHILAEEVAEAFAEEHPERLRAELIQVAAVVVAWIEAIDRRTVVPS
jgi:hypothetical protein